RSRLVRKTKYANWGIVRHDKAVGKRRLFHCARVIHRDRKCRTALEISNLGGEDGLLLPDFHVRRTEAADEIRDFQNTIFQCLIGYSLAKRRQEAINLFLLDAKRLILPQERDDVFQRHVRENSRFKLS